MKWVCKKAHQAGSEKREKGTRKQDVWSRNKGARRQKHEGTETEVGSKKYKVDNKKKLIVKNNKQRSRVFN